MNEKEIMELVNKAIAKDNQAMENLYKTYYRDVLYVCKKLNLNDADANDIAQDAFIDAFSKLNTLKDKSKFKQWVCRIANNKALNLLKHNNIIKFDNIDDDNSFTEIPDKEKSAETQVIENEVADILKNIIEKLPLEQKITVFMYYYEDMSVKEIAQAYGISENTVRSRLNYAKKFITSEVNKLEDKGIKLRCTALLPFLYLLFVQENEAFAAGIADSAIPSATGVIAKAVKNAVSGSTSSAASVTTATNTATTAASASVASTTTKVAGTVAKTGFSIGKIIGISSAIVAVIAAAFIGFTMFGNNDKKDDKDDDQKVTWNDSLTENTDKDNEDSDNNTEENNDTSNDSENNNNVEDEEKEFETGDEYWNYYLIESVNLPEVVCNPVEYSEGKTAYIADTFFKFTPEEVTEIIKNSEYLKSKNEEYTFTTDLQEECFYTTFSDIGVQKQYSNVDHIVHAYPKSNIDEVVSTGKYDYYDFDGDFRVLMTTDYTNYSTPNYIIFNISNIDISREEQDKAFTYLTSFLGEELAKYLVYSGESRNIEEKIQVGNTTYTLERKLNFDNEEEHSDSLMFKIEITHSLKSNSSYYNGNYVSALNKELFDLNKYIFGNFGSTSLDDLVNFGSEYMKFGVNEKYVGTSAERCKYIIYNLPDGTVEETFILDTVKGCDEVALIVCPDFNIFISQTTKNNEINDLRIKFDGGLGLASSPDDTEPDYTPFYAPLIGKLKALLGDSVDISAIDMNAFNESKGMSFETSYLDIPCEGYISYDYGTSMSGLLIGEYELSIDMKNKLT